MTQKERLILPLFEKFLRDTRKGKRLKPDGTRIKPQSVKNYEYLLSYLREYEDQTSPLRLKASTGKNARLFLSEKKYWKTFYLKFSDFLYREKECHDNYVGAIMKSLRVFFNYLEKDYGIQTGGFYKDFYVCKEDIPVISLLPEQLIFLINDSDFDSQLNPSLKKAKDILVFGCTVALRVSDLFNIKITDFEETETGVYLTVKTIKTGTVLKIKLPGYAIAILKGFTASAKKRKLLFPPIPRTRFNLQLKTIAEMAGWTQELGKFRSKKGMLIEEKTAVGRYRFCDLVSSHIMRRSAITTMLMMGVKEHVVKKISGHTADSKSFYRYVNLAQSYMDYEMAQAFSKLSA